MLYAGNYCVGCHTADDVRLTTTAPWQGGVDHNTISPCPAEAQLREELYYTDRLLLSIDRAKANLAPFADVSAVTAKINSGRETYARLLDMPTDSVEAFTSEAQSLRFQLGKSYTRLNDISEALKQRNVLIVAGLVTLIVIGSLLWGYRHTTRFIVRGQGTGRVPRKLIVLLMLIFALFTLPIFKVFSAAETTTTTEAQARQTALDTATRAAAAGERALARAWELARVGAAWHSLDPQQAQTLLTEALSAAHDAEINSTALWGQTYAAQEAAIGEAVAQEKAAVIVNRLNAAQSRAWGLRQIAAEWLPIDPAQATEVLLEAYNIAEEQSGIYRDLDLRAIAATWAKLDSAKASEIANEIHDPAMRAWAYRDLAHYDQAVEAARQIADPVQKARALREIAVASGDATLFDEALSALSDVDGKAFAYAISDLAVAKGDAALVDRIDPVYAAARAAALYRLGKFDAAWEAANSIADPFDRAHAQAAIASAAGNAEWARQIVDVTLRDRALRGVSAISGDSSLVNVVETPYYQVQAFTALKQYRAAIEAAANVSDKFPLVQLAVAVAKDDANAALTLIDAMEREADKAEALRALAAGNAGLFDRALSMALAARVRNDALSPIEASLKLARDFMSIDQTQATIALKQALEAAQRISIK
ncbi:MAG: hypothetical protein HY870_10500 [Chloroflexi bacterium]|nr:hypothetical protein [Chloroflexota bacterium]